MSVFIVTEWGCYGHHLRTIGVYDSREAAERIVEQIKQTEHYRLNHYPEVYKIEEYPVHDYDSATLG